MRIDFEIPFVCEPELEPHLQRVFSGEYDLRVALPQGYRILDLGANCGAFSVWATHRWPGCSIQAFEPHPETFKTLTQNTLNYPNITPHNWGLGTPGMRILHDGLTNSGERSFHVMANNPMATGIHLEVMDPLTLPEAEVIKLDIEGCEMEVLEPLIRAGRSFELILAEYHNEHLRREMDKLLEGYALVGCDVQHIHGRGIVKYMNRKIWGGLQ